MEIILTSLKGKRAKVKTIDKTINLMTLLVAISKFLVERISEEKGVSMKEAEDIVVDCIKDGMKTIKE